MKKDKFINILQKDEEVLWAEGVNKFPFILKNIFKTSFGFAFAGIFLAQFITIALVIIDVGHGEDMSFLIAWPITVLCMFLLGIILGIIFSILEANNTYFAITDKRIIYRSGVFNQKYTHYSLKNIGTITVEGGLLDSKGENGSATLIVTIKDFHTNTDGNSFPMRLVVRSLNRGYKAYSLLSEKTEGNNESFRVKLEKEEE